MSPLLLSRGDSKEDRRENKWALELVWRVDRHEHLLSSHRDSGDIHASSTLWDPGTGVMYSYMVGMGPTMASPYPIPPPLC